MGNSLSHFINNIFGKQSLTTKRKWKIAKIIKTALKQAFNRDIFKVVNFGSALNEVMGNWLEKADIKI